MRKSLVFLCALILSAFTARSQPVKNNLYQLNDTYNLRSATDGQVLGWDSVLSRWTPQDKASPTNTAAGGSTGQIQYNNAGVLGGLASPTTTEIGYVGGVTSSIQNQLDTKAPLANPNFTGVAKFPNGLVGSPVIVSSAYPLNGLFWYESVASGRTNLAFVDNSKPGFWVDIPDFASDTTAYIYGSGGAGADANLRLWSASTGGSSRIYMRGGASGSEEGWLIQKNGLSASVPDSLQIVSSPWNVTALLISTNGFVSVGKSTEATTALDVNGIATATAFLGDGSGVTSLDADNISSGTMADARLSANVPLLNGNNTFIGNNSHSGVETFGNSLVLSSNSFSIYWVQDGLGQWTLYDDAGPSADLRISDNNMDFLGFASFLPDKVTFKGDSGISAGAFYLAEDPANGFSQGEIRAPASMSSDKMWTFPDVTGTVTLNSANNIFTGRQQFQDTVNDMLDLGNQSGAVSVSWATNAYALTATGDITSFTLSGSAPTSGKMATRALWFIQDATGSRTLTIGGNSISVRTAADSVTLVTISTKDGGATLQIGTDNAGGGSGTVTSVNVSGGTTGLTFTGGPITGSGTITASGTLAAANGGTGLSALGTGVPAALGNALNSGSGLIGALTPTKGNLIVGNGSAWVAVGTGTDGSVLVADSGQTAGVRWGTVPVQMTITIDGGGSAVTAGTYAPVRIKESMTVTGWDIVADQSGSCVVDLWKDAFANYPPTIADTVTGSEKPTLSAADHNQDTSLSTWTTTWSAGDYVVPNVEATPSTVTRITIVVYGTSP